MDLISARCAATSTAAFSAAGAERVLDYGCGIGSTALFLADAELQVVLSEVARESLEFARRRLERRGLEPADSLDLWDRPLASIEPGSLDGAVAFDVLEHLPNIEPRLEELDKALAPGAVFCFNQVYVRPDEGPHHYPQRGEALLWLHHHGYRLAHVPHVLWLAQKAALPKRERLQQERSIRARIAATKVAERLRGPGSAAAAHALIGNALH
jgi:SAM-dependent methyltransferase